MTEVQIHPVQPDWKTRALIDDATYRSWYEQSISDPDAFWREHGQRIDWSKPFTTVKNTSFDGDVSIRWFEDGETNVSANCIDRHLAERGDQVAIIWEGDDPKDDRKIASVSSTSLAAKWSRDHRPLAQSATAPLQTRGDE